MNALRIADFLFEIGMLKKTPRTGYQFLGSGQENVAEHSFRAAVIGVVLALHSQADIGKTALLCLFHDLPEARTGDFNYVNKIYNQTDERAALRDSLAGTGLEDRITDCFEEFAAEKSLEARLAHDADQLDLICNLREQQELGNPQAQKWIECALRRLRTPVGIEIAQALIKTDPNEWWFGKRSNQWWITGKNSE